MIYLFLKRARLADYFLLNNENISKFSSLLDWDEILSVSNLSDYFSVKLDCLMNQNRSEFEFKPFVFSSMPKEFLQFALKPYNFKFEAAKQVVLFNFIDYNYLISHNDDFNDAAVDDDEELEKNQKNIVMPQLKMNYISTILTTRYSRC
ncbi:hypothetical protein M9Y10_021416 [Tritrichomonas musculus]|uniref:Uncharacterized protein n=1 Tax=Tritrichomonas musculus TaxID=1915356 RepID=A0ABR2HF14_9EUKA